MVVTPWFEPDVQPVYKGVYQRLYDGANVVYCLWDGMQWCVQSPYPEAAARMTATSPCYERPWRGLAVKP